MKNKKIKILHIASHITGKADGIFTHLLMLFKNTNDNFQHLLYFKGSDEALRKLNNLPIIIFNSQALNKKNPIKFIKEIIHIIKESKIDIIQTHSTKSYLLVGLLNIILNKKHIYNYNGVFIFNKYYNWVEKIILYIFHYVIYLLKGCDMVIAPSKKSLEVLYKESRLFKNYRVYYNCAVDTNETTINENIVNSLTEIKQLFFLVGIISRIEIQKRIDIALNLVKSLKDKNFDNIYFVFIGDGPLWDEMLKLSDRLNISERVLFLNYIPNVQSYIKYFDILLFTSEWEGFPLTIWEAMHYAIPIVSSDVGGIKEILEGEKCGLVYPFSDIETCSNIIIELFNNKEKLKELGNNGRKAVLEKYTDKQFREFFEDLYTKLVYEK